MLNKKLLLITLLIILITGMGVISAEDVSDDTTISQVTSAHQASHESIDNTIQTHSDNTLQTQSENIKKINKTQQTTNKKATQKVVNSYEQLRETLTSSNESDVNILLEGNNFYTITENITLNENITNLILDGNGRTIFGNNTNTFLTINHSSNVLINNLTIANCNYSQDWIYTYYALTFSNGAAIRSYGANLTLNNSVLRNNGANATEASGGALYFQNGTLNINNCDFSSNWLDSGYSKNFGGAVCAEDSNIIITGSDFFNNYATPVIQDVDVDGEGGAVYAFRSNIYVNDSRFISNAAHTGSGIYIYGNNSTITNCFMEDNVESYGVIYNTNTGLYGAEEGYEGNLSIYNVTFEGNYCTFMDYVDGVVIVNYGNVTLNQSVFKNNGINRELAINCGGLIGHYGNILVIDNTVFEENKIFALEDEGALVSVGGIESRIMNTNFTNNNITLEDSGYSGVMAIHSGNVFVQNCDFINNSFNGTDAMSGVIYNNANLSLNDSNFINNSITATKEVHGGVVFNYLYSSINNSNFINNSVITDLNVYGGAISNKEKMYINNCNFTSNTIEGYSGSGGAIYSEGQSLYLNNSKFYYNSVNASVEGAYGGAIAAAGSKNITIGYCEFYHNNATGRKEVHDGAVYAENSEDYKFYSMHDNIFVNNNPSNFIIREGQVVINNLDKYGWDVVDYTIPLEDYVTIYKDEMGEGELYYINNSVITGFVASNREYVYKLVVSQVDGEENPNLFFKNNTFFVKLAHNYTLSLNPSDVKTGHEEIISGYFYYNDTEGNSTFFEGREVELYINDTLINKTVTDNNGFYTFTYKTDATGTQYVRVQFPGDESLNPVSNSTTFTVQKLETNIIFDQILENNITNKINITGKLVDEDTNGVANTTILLYINNNAVNVTTDENGIFQHEYQAILAGENHILGMYDESYYYLKTINTTNFKINKLNTTITLEATNTTINNEITITGRLTDTKNNPITNATIILFINGNETSINTQEDGHFTHKYTPNNADENYVEVVYMGNDTYIGSINDTKFMANKINTTITADIISKEVGNLSFNITLKDNENKTINEGIIHVYNENDEIITAQNIKENTTILITDITSGTHTFNIKYEGNDTHNSSNTIKTITIKPKAQTTIEILNNTEGNVTIEITVSDEKNNTIPEQEAIITLPNGTNITTKTDENGVINIVLTDTPTGEASITIEVPTNSNITGITETKNFTIEPDYHKIIEEMNNTINILNDTVLEQIEIINDLNATVQDQIKVIDDLNATVQDQIKVIDDLNATVQDQIEVIDDLNATVQEQNITINELNDTVKELNDTVKELNNTINEQQAVINRLNKTVQEQNQTIIQQQDTIKELENKIEQLENFIDTLNRTSTITVIAENGTVDNSNVTVTLNNKLGTPITNATITVTNTKNEIIGTGTTDNNGTITIPIKTVEGTENITVSYNGTDKYTPVNTTIPVTTMKNQVTIKVNPVRGIIGEDITLTAYLTDKEGNPINGGNLAFKLNGKTLRNDGRFDSSAPAMKFTVKDGHVTYTIKADLYLRNAKNLTASYSGTYKYEETNSETVEAQIQKRYAQVTLTVNPTKNKQYDTITFTATVQDATKNGKNTTLINQDTQVMFKVNGVTLKDKDGKTLYVNVDKNNQATYNYTIPAGTGGITASKQVRDYKVDAIFVGVNYYPGARNNSKFNVERSPTNVNITQAKVSTNNVLSVKATLKDFKGNNLLGTNKVTIKINGKSYTDPKNGKPKYWSVKNGVVDLNDIQVDTKTTIKRVMLVTGERQAYTEARTETTNIIRE